MKAPVSSRVAAPTVHLKVRARWKRALQWPWLLIGFRRAGASWRSAWRLTHHVVWYRVPGELP